MTVVSQDVALKCEDGLLKVSFSDGSCLDLMVPPACSQILKHLEFPETKLEWGSPWFTILIQVFSSF